MARDSIRERRRLGERWSPAQLDAYPRAVAALLAGISAGADACCGHREWAPTRKIDPTGIDMKWMRDSVAALLGGGQLAPRRGCSDGGHRGTDVRGWQQQLVDAGESIVVDGDFGPMTEAATRRLQERLGVTADGLVGPVTRSALGELALS